MPIDVTEHSNNIIMVVINNPAKRNALDEQMVRSLAELWPKLAKVNSLAAVVLTGAGDAFCAGADLSADLTRLPGIDDLVDGALMKTMFFPKPVIAAIGGACVAGGFELMLSCDIRICTPDARFGLPEARWGILPSGGGIRKLGNEIGYSRASELLLTGRFFEANEALAMGLVSEVVSQSELTDRALDAAHRISLNSPAATSAIKQYLHTARAPSAELERLERDLTLSTRKADAPEGILAFLEKRTPRYNRN